MYSERIVEHFTNPVFNGSLENSDFVIEVGNSVCGDRVKIDVLADDTAIKDARFQAWGCATSIATANIFCQYIINSNLADLHALEQENMAPLLGELSPSQKHCIDLLEALFNKMKSETGERQ